MRVTMTANVGLWETGHTYELPDDQADRYVELGYAERAEPEPTETEPAETVEPAGPAGKPGTGRRTKATKPPQNKTAPSGQES